MAHTCDDDLGVRWVNGVKELFCSHGWSRYEFPSSLDASGRPIVPRQHTRKIDVEPGGQWPPRVRGCRWCGVCTGPACQRHGGPGPAARQTWWRHHRKRELLSRGGS